MGNDNETARPKRFSFPRRMRLTLAKDFARLRKTSLRKLVGPLVISAAANERSHCRLGLAVSRRVGRAPARSTIKRRIREAFRRQQHSLPAGYDLLVSVRPHEPLPQQQYLNLLAEAANALHKSWIRQQKK
jgi:ribonuclease P protein component